MQVHKARKLLVSLDGKQRCKSQYDQWLCSSTIITLGAGEQVCQDPYSKCPLCRIWLKITFNTVVLPKYHSTNWKNFRRCIYHLRESFYDYNTGVLLSSSFGDAPPSWSLNTTLPMILLPTHNGTVLATQPTFTTMSWTPSGIPGTTRYKMELVDMDLNHLLNPNEAFSTIRPLSCILKRII